MGPIQIVVVLLIASVSVAHGDLNSIVNRLLAKYSDPAVSGIRGGNVVVRSSNVNEDDDNRKDILQLPQQVSDSRYENRDNEREIYHKNRKQNRKNQYQRSQRSRNDRQGGNKDNFLINHISGGREGSNRYSSGLDKHMNPKSQYSHHRNANYRGGNQYNGKLDKNINLRAQSSRGDRYDLPQSRQKASNLSPLIKLLLRISKEFDQQRQSSLRQRDRHIQRDNYNQNQQVVIDQRNNHDQVQQGRFDQPGTYDQRVQNKNDGRNRFYQPRSDQRNKQNYNRGIARLNDISRSPFIKSLLRISKDFTCEAQDECKNECDGKSKKCENQCEEEYQCGEEDEEEESTECDNEYDQCNSDENKNPSTRGISLGDENENNYNSW